MSQFMKYMEQGGPIMWLLLVANCCSFVIVAWKWVVFKNQEKNLPQDAEALLVSIQKEMNGKEIDLDYLKDKIQHHVFKLEKGLDFIQITASTSPLLGLLGTVLGMITAFDTISSKGLGSPEHFAGGIAMALITTAGGLLVAIPNGVLFNILTSKLNNIEFLFEQKLIPKVKEK
jgi:biopolymer transport protein ExbB